mgnify:CR=1 FL=1
MTVIQHIVRIAHCQDCICFSTHCQDCKYGVSHLAHGNWPENKCSESVEKIDPCEHLFFGQKSRLSARKGAKLQSEQLLWAKRKRRKKLSPHIPGTNAVTGPPNPEPAKSEHN